MDPSALLSDAIDRGSRLLPVAFLGDNSFEKSCFLDSLLRLTTKHHTFYSQTLEDVKRENDRALGQIGKAFLQTQVVMAGRPSFNSVIERSNEAAALIEYNHRENRTEHVPFIFPTTFNGGRFPTGVLCKVSYRYSSLYQLLITFRSETEVRESVFISRHALSKIPAEGQQQYRETLVEVFRCLTFSPLITFPARLISHLFF